MSTAPDTPSAGWRTKPAQFWTTTELAILRAHYPTGGVNACLPLLPRRSPSSIYQRANFLKLRCVHATPRSRARYPNEPHFDEQIRIAHQAEPTNAQIKALVDRIGRPRWWVNRRARELGLVTPRFAEQPWSEAELAIVDQTSQLRPQSTLRALRSAGFTRTETAVILKRKRLEIPMPKTPGVYQPATLAQMLGYDPKVATRWIRLGLLRATERKGVTRIREADIRNFLRENPMQVDLRKLPLRNRPWFYRLLTTRQTTTQTPEQSA